METCPNPLTGRARSAVLAAVTISALSLVLAAGPAAARHSSAPARNVAQSSGSYDDGAVPVGGHFIMKLRSDSGGPSASEMANEVEDRLTEIVAVPDIKPWHVVVYAPAGQSPTIYVLGRRFVTLNPATVRANGGPDARTLAIQWARVLQQTLPRIDIRLPNEPEPKVPAHPPLVVTSSLAQVGGNDGPVDFRGKTVMVLHGIQPGGETAAERADVLSSRLNTLACKIVRGGPDAVSVRTVSGAAEIEMGGKPVYRVTEADARESGAASPADLAHSWAAKIRRALEL